MYEILATDITSGNFGEWSKAFIEKSRDTLQSKFDTAVSVNADAKLGDIRQEAVSKISGARQEAQIAYDDATAYKKKIQKTVIIVVIGIAAFLFFNGKVKL